MDNPWKGLISESDSLILPQDSVAIHRYNNLQRNAETIIATELVPEPFIGNPQTARLVLLGLNPGLSETDARNHRDAGFR